MTAKSDLATWGTGLPHREGEAMQRRLGGAVE
jgi:hypothetical protein